ncbi:MAG: aminopeptidase P family protein [Mesorhizobium sp.]|nr:MAG: aminopeptidase P family protein [Mesorhizobium sp.]RWH85140.1 MAG: aminopeptidase P family protein [Mesorhizobium sp.]RWH89895.1 MAG: aminopeptidase P family protein [Mesorhizobium sp.]RWH98356.1 MAG: aminopeptidase P family protein [Mesorhizobium sp.]RWI04637.1 MAG: aminopeptidase P family protein [Mesorhizobium sp.]
MRAADCGGSRCASVRWLRRGDVAAVNDLTTLRPMTELAGEHRTKIFALVANDVGLIMSSSNANKAYLSGYASMAHDVASDYKSAVLATRDHAALVVSAADAGPALEAIEDPGLLYRYGEFYFETTGREGRWFEDGPSATFEEAAGDAVSRLQIGRELVGIDRSDGDLLWNMGREILGEQRVVDVTNDLRTARARKTRGEIERLRRATSLVENGLHSFIANARVGMTEIDIAALISERIAGGGGVPRFVSVTSGPRSALADAYPSGRSVAAGELIRIDAGCTFDGYWSDVGRTFIFGEPDARQSALYQAILSGLEAELAMLKAGVTASAVFDAAMSAVRAGGIPQYRRQHCGHGIGLRSYDSPLITSRDGTELLEGMCLCLETPYYELGREGMMVEDTVCVTPTGHEPITSISRELVVLS